MVESLVKKSDLKTEAKAKLFMAKVYIVAAIIVAVLSCTGSYLIVKNKGQATLNLAQTINENRDFALTIKDLDSQLATLLSKPPKYDLAIFLPAGEMLTELTRQFDTLFSTWNTVASPINSRSINFGKSVFDEEKNVNVLPLTIVLSSSVENFSRLLSTIETSGLPGSQMRAMDVQSVSLNLGTVNDNLIDYTISINAYSKP